MADEYVTKDTCELHQKSLNKQNVIIITLVGLFVTAAGFALNMAYGASCRSMENEHQIELQKLSSESDKKDVKKDISHVLEKVEAIQEMLGGIQKDVNDMKLRVTN